MKPTLRQCASELGFSDLGFATARLEGAEERLMDWLSAGYHGSMDYMARHGATRARPTELVPGTCSILTARMDYPPGAQEAWSTLEDPRRAYVARYALGRDYHKLMRQRLQKLAGRITEILGPFSYRAFSDSAPVMEVEIARRTRLGWEGKHTLLLTRQGSWFFLGELFTSLPFQPDPPHVPHCGDCRACIEVCPTQAIRSPYRLDARRCISYLTIEHAGPIAVELRPLLGNRIYGCDDCQLICPWNRFARPPALPDFLPRHNLDQASLLQLFAWDEATFLARLEGSPIRRIGHERWLRNLAVALGNAPYRSDIVSALEARADHPSAQLREHLQWALERQHLARRSPSA
ncbi:MAG TPA: tRNA epoxyqueuosine(34) reductase QueG [Thiobacillaceae bacterium]|nr:tRNA epoxyqueuosine(34) reductase QueG [Thiobacillaceae bacterium]HNU64146.1 tRNA epoxyqueuosine(34) reductase QueG [Thiobacillaceae bacterium]